MSIELKRTERGFAKAEFTDHYGEKCSIQKSSIIEPEAIWLGIDEVAPIEGKYMGRMHLTQDQVRDLLPLLQRFAETGELA